MKTGRISLSLGTCFLLTACAPIPHFHYHAPALSGVVVSNGVPVHKAEVRVKGADSKEVQVATTGPDGRFKTPPIRSFQLIAHLAGDPIYVYEIEIVVGDLRQLAYRVQGLGSVPNEREVRCDLLQTVDLVYGGPSHCAAREDLRR